MRESGQKSPIPFDNSIIVAIFANERVNAALGRNIPALSVVSIYNKVYL